MTLAETLDRWHDMVARRDMTDLPEIVHPDAVFRSPVAHTPYPTRDAVVLALRTVLTVFEDFRYHRTFREGHDAVLEFSARVNGKDLRGVDLIRVDDDGLITEFEVMVRPLSGLQALGEEMGRRIGAQLKDLA
ncbi:nuclear transport factor 2 family protein [Actinomycetospora termitidis]|uniref:Nuclear transport factor 2 family protein n=1 Tax=Actinomycetospora termitidis TaxID=3053470 RepID=A0ABT7MJE0_9PSEU|nr:nuclear transport factor 2 family protein [Actinomycetospora sp. Odt1-22]MDL5160334.1 nuclear transport factor 2 family protein [Actinomycetospora sp. Odt1-22]